ncbi:hypothetical protein Btru_053533 [Bulinus truncatus]|nr:hypothetical protein Btru_053533 [Bulinus truncatus]
MLPEIKSVTRILYVKRHHYQASLTDSDKERLETHIRKFITISLKETSSHEALYANGMLLRMLKSAIKLHSIDNDDVMPVAKAFESLEKYFLLLVEQPWKSEFKRIKTYGGFYRTKIKSVLPECDKIFQLAGYIYFKENSVMTFDGPLNEEKLLLLAFDCKISNTLCIMICDLYTKGKCVGMSLDDAVSTFLQTEKINSVFNSKPIMHFEMTKSGINSKPTAEYVNGDCYFDLDSNLRKLDLTPPAIPKREPLLNGSNPRKINVQHESEMVFDDNILFPPSVPERTSVSLYANSPSQYSRSPLPPNIPPLLSENIIPEAFVDEVLPDLKQGTSDEHILESWKVLEQQRNPKHSAGYMGPSSIENLMKPDDFKYNPYNQNHLAKLSTTTLGMPSVPGLTHPPVHRTRQGSAHGSIDEGIDCRSFNMGSRYSMPGPSPANQRSNPGFSQSYYDAGYKTGPPSDTVFSQSSNFVIPQHTIYHPPNILTDGFQPGYNMKQAAGPPPIPSRTLKPSYSAKVLPEDVIDSTDRVGLQSPFEMARGQSQSDIILSPTYKAGLAVQTPTLTNAKQLQYRDKMFISKSNSLKYNGDRDSIHQQLAPARAAHSMDMTLLQWVCKSCTSVNSAASTVCNICSHSRHGPDVSQQPECGTTGKACPKCTLNNDLSRTLCEVCGEKLQDRYTYV